MGLWKRKPKQELAVVYADSLDASVPAGFVYFNDRTLAAYLRAASGEFLVLHEDFRRGLRSEHSDLAVKYLESTLSRQAVREG